MIAADVMFVPMRGVGWLAGACTILLLDMVNAVSLHMSRLRQLLVCRLCMSGQGHVLMRNAVDVVNAVLPHRS